MVKFTLLLTTIQSVHVQGGEEEPVKKDEGYFEQFSLKGEMLPPYLSIRVLHKIVFIGESVDMFENNDSIEVKSEFEVCYE